MKPAYVSFARSTKLRVWGSGVRISSGAPSNKINDLDGRLAALAAVVSGSLSRAFRRSLAALMAPPWSWGALVTIVAEFDYPAFSRRFRTKPKFLVNDAEFNIARHGKTYFYDFGLLLPKTASVSRPAREQRRLVYSVLSASFTRPRFVHGDKR